MAKPDGTTQAAESGLKKELGIFELTATGVGIILGAGIYVVIGKAAGLAGGAIWVPFLIGALAAALTGMSYAELASMFPKAAASFEYTKRAFGLRVAFLVGWLLLFSNMVSAGAVALGFGGYLSSFLGLSMVPIAIALIAVSSLVLLVGVRESVWLGVAFTAIEVVGLIIVIAVSSRFIGSADYLDMPQGIGGLFRATTLLFFAYLGFEQVANLSEEARNPSKAIPTAIIIAVAITTVLYVAVAVSSVSALDWRALSESDAPLADVVQAATGTGASQVVAIIALFATANTVLFLLLTASRMMYGMSASATLPRPLGIVGAKRKTPWVATLVAGGVAACFTLLGKIEVIAQLTNFSTLLAFVMVNASLVWLRLKRPDIVRGFRVPLCVGKVPVPALLGVVVSLFMLANTGMAALAFGAAIAALGLAAPFLMRGFGKSDSQPDAGSAETLEQRPEHA